MTSPFDAYQIAGPNPRLAKKLIKQFSILAECCIEWGCCSNFPETHKKQCYELNIGVDAWCPS